jgi:hypothetical protein
MKEDMNWDQYDNTKGNRMLIGFPKNENLKLTREIMREIRQNDGRSGESLLRHHAWEVKESPVDLGYMLVPDWLKMPDGWTLGQVAGVEADSQNRIYVYHHGHEAQPFLCFDNDGNYLF